MPLTPLRQALRYRNLDGVCTKTMDTLTGGPFLVGLALALGASNLQIGFIAALPFLSKVMLIPAVWVVEKVRRRKRICVTGNLISRPLWFLVVAGALTLSAPQALGVLLSVLAVVSVVGAFSGLAWNAWMKDLLPERIRGRVFSRRLWLMGLVSMVLSLAGAAWVDALDAGGPVFPLAVLFALGAAVGLVGVYFLSRIPERPTPQPERFALRAALSRPFRDERFRRLIGFSGSWAFATNLALPFITVYMLSTLGLSFSAVMAFTVASQLANLSFLNIWGRVADRFGSKAVLFACAPVFSLSLLLWTFTTGGPRWLTLGLVGLIHVMNGLATAGIDVANTNLLYKMAPAQASTPYFASAALINSLAAGLAPLAGGAIGNAFAQRALSLSLLWERLDEVTASRWTAVRFAHLDFVFLAAFVLGLFALQRLSRVRERPREVPRGVVIKSVKEEVRNVSSIKGMRHLTQAASFFAGLLLESGAWLSRTPSGKGTASKPEDA